MPNRWPISSGNWSNAAIWSGSLIPTASDDVFANNFTVNMDTSFQVLTLRSTSATGVSTGGSFNFNSGSISGSVTSTTPLVPGATNLIQVTATTGTVTLTLGGAVERFLQASSVVINHSGPCNLVLSGSSFSGGGGDSATVVCISKSSTGNLSIVGSLSGGNAPNAGRVALSVGGAGTVTVTGAVVGGTGGGGTQHAISQTAGTLIVNGNVDGSSVGSTNHAISFSGTSLIINGTCTGGAANNAVSTTATTNIISGSVTGAGAAAISYTSAGSLTVSGSCTAGSVSPAVVSTSAAATNIFTGPFINTNNTMAVQCVDMVLTQDASTFWNFGDITLYSPEQLAYYPSASDIRQGVTYADGTVSGSLAMPPPTAVIAGTPTDNTTGSAVLTPAQLQDAVWGRDLSQMTETGSIGFRLAKSATTDSTGNQLASYLI